MFNRLLLCTIAIGALIGYFLPGAETPDKALATPVAKAPDIAQAPAEIVLERGYNGHFFVNATVNGQLVRFLVDTGASGVALTMEDARRVGVPFSPDQFTVVGHGAGGDVRGARINLSSVAVGRNQVTDVAGVVLDQGLPVSLLGQSFLTRIGSVQISQDRMILR